MARTALLLLMNGAASSSLAKQQRLPAMKATPLLQECRGGCLVALEPCNASDATQLWDYQPTLQDTVQLRGGPDTTHGLCLNIYDYGKAAGDQAWVSLCHPEHPLSANSLWTLEPGGHLLNRRSKLCLSETMQLAPCDLAAPNITHTAAGLLETSQSRCVAVRPGSGPPPPHSDPPAPPGPPSPPRAVTVDLSHPRTLIHTTDSRYVSFTLDGSYNRGWFQRNLSNPLLRFLTKEFVGDAGAILRFGGSGNDYFDYDVPTGKVQPTLPACRSGHSYPDPRMPGTAVCPPWSDSKHCAENAKVEGFCSKANAGPQPNCCRECNFPWAARFPNISRAGCQGRSHGNSPATLTCTCLDQPRLDGLLDFASATGVSLVFGLTISADVNSSHTLALLQHIHDKDSEQRIYGFEYGNEQESTLANKTQAIQFAQLQEVLAKLFADKAHVPVLIGPDTNGFPNAVNFLKQALDLGVKMHGITYHEYTTSVGAMQAETLAKMRSATNKSGTEELWVGEAGGASGGGRLGLTDAYASGLWWLPALGEKAKSGHSIYCRQDLVGGDYGLLHDDFPWNVAVADTPSAKEAVVTRPDYWTGLLFKRLMGNGVLQTEHADPSPEHIDDRDMLGREELALLSYCHCSRRFDQGLALLLVNPANANTLVTVQFTASGGSQWDVILYRLAAGPNSTDILLNGQLLQVTKTPATVDGGTYGWSMPPLDGTNVSSTGSTHTVNVGRQSYVFLEYPNAMVSACAHRQIVNA